MVVSTADTPKGADKGDTWLELLGNDVVVMTYTEFNEYYESGILAFSQIGILIISNPLLALKSDHILSTIVPALRSTPEEERPKVFGLLLISGATFRFSIDHARLEELLGARFHSITEEARQEVLAMMDQPKELVVRFNPPKKVVDTALCKHLRSFKGSEHVFRTEFRSAKIV